jgi:hypothetical protein
LPQIREILEEQFVATKMVGDTLRAQLDAQHQTVDLLEGINGILTSPDPRPVSRGSTLPTYSTITGVHGRQLKIILAHAQESTLPVYGLRGMGGAGKTHLALNAARALEARFGDASLYVDLRSMREAPLLVRDAQTQLIRDLNTDSTIPDDDQELTGLYLALLAGRSGALVGRLA